MDVLTCILSKGYIAKGRLVESTWAKRNPKRHHCFEVSSQPDELSLDLHIS